jgi:signal peptidase I
VLSPQALGAVQTALDQLKSSFKGGADNAAIRLKVGELQSAADQWLKPYPHAVWRENFEVLLVALGVAMAVRTFFLQPFKIPTGSMQPTLFGVTSVPDFSPSKLDYWAHGVKPSLFETEAREQLHLQDTLEIPTGWKRVKEWFMGNSYVHVVAQRDGVITGFSPVTTFLIFNLKQTLWINGMAHTIWFPPDFGDQMMGARAGDDVRFRDGQRVDLFDGHVFHKGEDVIKMKVSAGDHLFVDRLSFNFRKPERGEIVVFATVGTKIEEQDQFYVKRLTVLPGERVSIGNDRHIRINGQRLDASTAHFENVYGFDPKTPPHESRYSGHLNNAVAAADDIFPGIAPLFADENTVFTNRDDSYMVFGDNTCNSSDSRFWGTFPARNIIGKSFFVYWPLTDRFGVGYH